MNKFRHAFFIIALLAIVLTCLTMYGFETKRADIKGIGSMRYGIDIRGGVEAVYKPRDLNRSPTGSELESARVVLETRLDSNNIFDREITVDKTSGTILVRFPWKSDETEFNPQKAIAELGETAHLTFRDPDGAIILDGKNVKSAVAGYNDRDRYVVQLEFDSTGSKLFADATSRLIGQRIGIYMDEILISDPTVNVAITDGSAIITGMRDNADAIGLAKKIESGSLPFALISDSHSIISPSLGSGALSVMAKAGIVSFILVCLFMLVYYRLLGAIACIALVIQATGQLLALSVPQFTLTLPGIAAIILSIGMGVDANIITAERIKEELRSGKSLSNAIKTGFHKAFSSVFDGNITVIIVAVILMIFGSGSMLSFGYSLLTGVILNFVAGITASRLMILSLSSFKLFRNPVLYGVRTDKL